LRRLCGSVPERGHQVELKRPVATKKLAKKSGKWRNVRVPCLIGSNYEGRETWHFWIDCFAADRRKRLQTSAAMIRAGAAAVRSTRGATTNQTRSTSPRR